MEFEELPDDCMSLVLSLTSPKDACRSALVSLAFRSAAQSESLWDRLLPDDHRQIISRSVSPVTFTSKKDLFFRLCDSPILLDRGNVSFSLEKSSGKKCWMLGARALSIPWGDSHSPKFWEWNSHPQSRFSEVAELACVWWFEIKGRIETKMLSPRTTYAAYLVYRLGEEYPEWGLQDMPFTVRVSDEQNEVLVEHDVFLCPPEGVPRQTGIREDGWTQIELAEIFNKEDNANLECQIETESVVAKCGLIVEGIELRPKLDTNVEQQTPSL